MPTINELREERGRIVKQMQDMTAKATADKRDFTAEENENFAKADADQNRLRSLIEREEKVSAYANELSQPVNAGPGRETVKTGQASQDHETALRSAWQNYLRHGEKGLSSADLNALRSMTVGTAGNGGYLAPSQPQAELVKLIKDQSSLLGAPVRIIQTTGGATLTMPVVNDTATNGNARAEGATIAAGTDPTFTQLTLGAFKFDSAILPVSLELMQDSAIPIEPEINTLLAERLGPTINTQLTTGVGTTAPTGIVTGAGASGVSLPAAALGTGTPGTAAYAASVIGNLLSIQHSIGPQYRKSPATRWVFNDSTLLALKQITDANGRPIWQPDLSGGGSDRLLGDQYVVNPAMSAIGTGLKSIVYGDLSKFYVRLVNGIEVKRSDELYFASQMVAFLAWVRFDSKVSNSNAIKYAVHA